MWIYQVFKGTVSREKSYLLLKFNEFIIGGSCHKYHFCHDKSFVATNTLIHNKVYLLRQKFCRDKSLAATKASQSRQNVCRYIIIFVATKIRLSRQAYFCRDKNYTCGSSRQWCTTSAEHFNHCTLFRSSLFLYYSLLSLSLSPPLSLSHCLSLPLYISVSVCLPVSLSLSPCRASARPAYAGFFPLVPVKNKVAGSTYRLKLSALRDLLEILCTLGPGSKWKLWLSETASGVDQRAKQ